MATYAIGDLQGCEREFRALLRTLGFGPSDKLWLLGDLINRGPSSLGVLRYVRSLGSQCEIILGNHDLHFLAIFFGGHSPGRSDTFDELLAARDVEDLAQWLRRQRLIHTDPALGCTMVHAGLPPQWTLEEAHALAAEVEDVIGGGETKNGVAYPQYFREMYGNEPDVWDASLAGMDRLRVITNYFTRMRLLDEHLAIDFAHKGTLADAPPNLTPWFELTAPKLGGERLLFGHWAALDGETGFPDVIALDTGCVWGRQLSAMCLETGEITRQDALR